MIFLFFHIHKHEYFCTVLLPSKSIKKKKAFLDFPFSHVPFYPLQCQYSNLN